MTEKKSFKSKSPGLARLVSLGEYPQIIPDPIYCYFFWGTSGSWCELSFLASKWGSSHKWLPSPSAHRQPQEKVKRRTPGNICFQASSKPTCFITCFISFYHVVLTFAGRSGLRYTLSPPTCFRNRTRVHALPNIAAKRMFCIVLLYYIYIYKIVQEGSKTASLPHAESDLTPRPSHSNDAVRCILADD